MTTLILEIEPQAQRIDFDDRTFTIHLADGRQLTIPLDWYPRLQQATPAERQNWQLLGDGYAIEWPDLDEHIGITGLLAGKRSGESARSFDRWLTQRRSTSIQEP
ncbi:DUF2442 domain-containing protein [Limnothrix sp. FACHB-1083]|uniref:DUF2442 domain-containing protein n=1 Tax=unclassified Limnothrix TaxID=2632864 RepID=UPI0016817568|nr:MULTISPECIES: DUF2442 domain-containing protein [unclassified Limnothrix]MBD2161757.1 DUF2442 domain-containing protein [Limnothrix sp. FACHB-1083]MBD2192666.1 DUF2442 domain-containing protein [Limnothrix sp. FACHB-1088]